MNKQKKLQHTAKLSPSKRISASPASFQALLSRQSWPIKLVLGISQRPSILGIISPASQMVIIRYGDLINRQESRILIDGDDITPTTGLRGVAGARVVALALVKLLAVNGVAAIAHAIVLQPGVAEAVALADGDAFLDGHVLLVELAAQAESVRVAGVGVAA